MSSGRRETQIPAKFLTVIDTVLPPSRLGRARLTSGFGPRNVVGGSANHRAIDFAYPGRDVPPGAFRVYSPVDGQVAFAGGQYNTISIRDSSGYLHQFLHNDTILVRQGQSVTAGTAIGTMGRKGPYSRYQYKTHVHYQLKTAEGALLNPIDFWDGRKQVFVNIPKQENGLPVEGHPESDNIGSYDLAASEVEYHNQISEGSAPTISSYRPRMAAIAPKSGALGALLPNRTPGHEPWPRVMNVNTLHVNGPTDETDYNTRTFRQHDPESDEGAQLIGKLEGEDEIARGPFWRR